MTFLMQFYHGSISPTGTTYVGGAQDNGSWKYLSGAAWTKGMYPYNHSLMIGVGGGDGGFTAVDYSAPIRFYSSYVYTNIYRHDTGNDNNVPILADGDLQGGILVVTVTTHFIQEVARLLILILWIPSIPQSFTLVMTSYGKLAMPEQHQSRGRRLATSSPQEVERNPLPWQSLRIQQRSSLETGMVSHDSHDMTIGSFWIVTPPAAPSKLATSFGGAVSSITVDPTSNSIVYVTISAYGVPHLLKSTNGGTSFTSLAAAGVPDVIPFKFLTVRFPRFVYLFILMIHKSCIWELTWEFSIVKMEEALSLVLTIMDMRQSQQIGSLIRYVMCVVS